MSKCRFGSVQKISRLDIYSQSKLQMLTLFTGCHIGRPSNMVTPYEALYNFAQNVSTNISTLGECTRLKLGALSSLYIVYKYITFP